MNHYKMRFCFYYLKFYKIINGEFDTDNNIGKLFFNIFNSNYQKYQVYHKR